MSQASDTFAKSIDAVLEVVMFENWLRFYFIAEEQSDAENAPLFLLIPEQGMTRIKELYPHLAPLAEDMQGKELTFEASRSAVCTHVVTEVDGKTIPQNMSNTIFDSATFQVELHLFNTWVQGHEEQLDEQFLEFGAWRNFFSQWRSSDSVKELALQMMSAGTASKEEAKTVQ